MVPDTVGGQVWLGFLGGLGGKRRLKTESEDIKHGNRKMARQMDKNAQVMANLSDV
jgi:hypothetical protein